MNKRNPSSQLEMSKRVRNCQEWIMNDFTWSDIIQNCMSKWEVSKRTAERYYSKAFHSFKDTLIQDVENRKAYYLQKKKKLIRDMSPEFKKTPAGVNAINKVLDSMANLEGIVITKVEVTGAGGGPIPTEVTVRYIKTDAPPFANSEGDVQL